MPISRRAKSDQDRKKEQDVKDALRAAAYTRDAAMTIAYTRDAAMPISEGELSPIGYTSGGYVRGPAMDTSGGIDVSKIDVRAQVSAESAGNDTETALRLTESAPQLYDMYSKFIDQGFTEDQAMRCVLATIRGLREEVGE